MTEGRNKKGAVWGKMIRGGGTSEDKEKGPKKDRLASPRVTKDPIKTKIQAGKGTLVPPPGMVT